MPESTTDHWNGYASSADKTALIGNSLAHSLYQTPITILFSGDLGAGKTTFIQGLAKGLGIDQMVVSPTFALEQRTPLPSGGNFIHIDLYRIQPTEAARILAESDDDHAIRCIEWSERLPSPVEGPVIRVHLAEEGAGRRVSIEFDDLPLPSPEQVDEWRKEVKLPSNIIAHCETVAAVADQIAQAITARGTVIRPLGVRRAAQLHDLLRFVDFKLGGAPPSDQPESPEIWHQIEKQYDHARHELAGARFLTEHGYAELGDIVRPHGLTLTNTERVTIEQKVLYYADKRCAGDRIVTLDERFEDFNCRYGASSNAAESAVWYHEGRQVEAELFPGGVPF